jgi:Domain of unknown function (DUF3854)
MVRSTDPENQMNGPSISLDEQPGNLLLPHHLNQLTKGSGIAAEVIAAHGYRSMREYRSPHGQEDFEALVKAGFSKKQAKLTPALLIPILDCNGQPSLYQLRPDNPRIDSKGRTTKYETPKGARMRLDFATGQREFLRDPAVPLWITEGVKKVDALRSQGFCAIGLMGVWNWRGRNSVGGTLALADWEEITLKGREVYIAFDSDVTTKPQVKAALTRFQGFLTNRGARPHVVLLPAKGPEKVGMDDYLLTDSADELKALAERQQSEERDRGEDQTLHYRITKQGLQWQKATRDGDVWVPLTNFTAAIVSDIVRDDGAERFREYELQADLQGRSLRFTIPAAQFPAMNWPMEHLGAQAMVYPGQMLKDHARAAIQTLSDVIVERRIFTHTGWRKGEGAWYFFHGGGVLEVNGHVANMEVKLSGGLELKFRHKPKA